MAPKGNKNAVGNSGLPVQKYTDAFISQVAKDLLKWSERHDALFIESFVGEYKVFVDQKLFYQWETKHHEFSDAYKKVKKKLLGRLKAGSALKSLDGNFVAKILPLVDLEYREWRTQENKTQLETKSIPVFQVVNYNPDA